jgi:hypothetical protein
MNGISLFHGAGLFLAFGLGTWLVGWWAVPVIALGWGLLTVGRIRSWIPGISAALAWSVLLAADARSGALGRLLVRLAGVLHTQEVVPVLLTLVFPGFLAWSGAKLGAELARRTPQDTVSGPD